MRQFKNTFLLLFLFLFLGKISAQNIAINKTGATANASALLDLESTDQGLLTPRMTSAQRTAISSPANGLLVFDTDTNSFWFYDASAWAELNSGETTFIADDDDDTKIQVEESANEDFIRFDVDGNEVMIIDDQGQIGINNSTPQGLFHVKPTPPSGSGSLDQSSLESDGAASSGANWGQSFIPANTGLIDQIAVDFGGSGTATGTLNIIEGEGTSGGTVIHTESFSATESGDYYWYIPVSNASVTSGVVYTFQILLSNGSRSMVYRGTINPYPNGKFYKNDVLYNNSTPNDNDMKFKVYILPTPPQNEVLISSDGRVGIGTTAPAYDLHVNGTVAGTSAYTNLSDQRYKKDIQPLENALEKIMKIEGVSFDWRQSEFPKLNFSKGREIGFIAQNLKPIFPEIVNQDEAGFHSVEYANLVPVLVEAVKELSQKLDVAQKQIDQQSVQLSVQGKELKKIKRDLSDDESAFIYRTKNGNNE